MQGFPAPLSVGAGRKEVSGHENYNYLKRFRNTLGAKHNSSEDRIWPTRPTWRPLHDAVLLVFWLGLGPAQGVFQSSAVLALRWQQVCLPGTAFWCRRVGQPTTAGNCLGRVLISLLSHVYCPISSNMVASSWALEMWPVWTEMCSSCEIYLKIHS